MISWTAVYVLWLREMKRYIRAKSRIIGSLIQPLVLPGLSRPRVQPDGRAGRCRPA